MLRLHDTVGKGGFGFDVKYGRVVKVKGGVLSVLWFLSGKVEHNVCPTTVRWSGRKVVKYGV